MNIKRLSLLDGAKDARGTAVVIDVFRAFTCEPLMYHFGAQRIILERDIESCRKYDENVLLAGEKDGRPIDGFHLSNSPSHLIEKGVELINNRCVVHRTTSGTTGALTALEHANEVLLASFVNARATVRYILKQAPELVSIVAMGVASVEKTPEDELCGDYIESLLSGKPYDHVQALGTILTNESAQRFLRGDKSYYPKEDPVICLQRDVFDFALLAQRSGETVSVKKVNVEYKEYIVNEHT